MQTLEDKLESLIIAALQTDVVLATLPIVKGIHDAEETETRIYVHAESVTSDVHPGEHSQAELTIFLRVQNDDNAPATFDDYLARLTKTTIDTVNFTQAAQDFEMLIRTAEQPESRQVTDSAWTYEKKITYLLK